MSKLTEGESVKRSVDISADTMKKIKMIGKKEDRSVTWVINNLLKKALEIK